MDFAVAREKMVESQLRTNRVSTSLILGGFETLPRERFVPAGLESIAYVDEDLPIGEGRFLMEPMVVGRLLEAAEPTAGDSALVIGAGYGYEAALVSQVVGAVVALESVDEFAERMEGLLAEVGCVNASVARGPLTEGWPEAGPYTLILFVGAIEILPDAIKAQLADGGRLLAVHREGPVGRAKLYRRDGGYLSARVLFDAGTPLLKEFAKPPAFVF